MTRFIRVIDFETTGLASDEASAVCEVAYCDVDIETREVRDPISMLCNPGVPIPVLASAIHHICDEDVADAITPRDACLKIVVDSPNAIYCAHNADFERHFFNGGASWICTYKVALRLWPNAPSHSNQALRYHLALPVCRETALPSHRAGPDAYVTAHLLAACLADGRADISAMLRWSDGPALLPRINFGKHKGSRWEDAPIDYLEWVANKSDLDKDVKANARHHLKKRAPA